MPQRLRPGDRQPERLGHHRSARRDPRPHFLTVGRHDEMWPSHMLDMQAGIPGSELVSFEESSHMAFVEEREAYIATMNRFLERVEHN